MPRQMQTPLPRSLKDWPAPAYPSHDAIAGRWARLEPLDPVCHAADLAAAFAGADALWTYLPAEPPQDDAAWLALLTDLTTRSATLAFAVRDLRLDQVTGFLTIMEIRTADGVAEIGWVGFSPLLQRTPAATEAVFLLLKRLFDAGYRRVEWKCDADNAASRRAAERFGFRFEGVFRQHMIRKGRNRDTAWFAMLDGDWPARADAFAAWLSPNNFDAEGRQRLALRRAS